MIYEFECTECGLLQDIEAPMKDGPPEIVPCPICDHEMNRVFSCNFILKGSNWPGKDIKRVNDIGEAREQVDAQMAEDARNQRIVDEVISVRRKGAKATEEFKKSNPQKFADYESAINKGYRAKAKSYNVKAEPD